MSSDFGTHVQVSVFGESHGPAIGTVVHSLPAGEAISTEKIAVQLARRAPGQDATATSRREKDAFEILSGLKDGKTTGAPFSAVIRNEDTRSGDYGDLAVCPRPSHADYPAYIRYGGFNDVRGGGHFSGRLTAPLVIAGSVCRQILSNHGIHIGGHVLKIGLVSDEPFDPVSVSPALLDDLSGRYFSTLSDSSEKAMRDVITEVKSRGDSIGGLVELAVTGLPAGIGSPMFGGVENVLSAALFAVPAVKGVSFGDGFGFAELTGSLANDPLCYSEGKITALTNHCGGTGGGITTGMPLIITVALKPTPSIATPQQTVNLKTDENTTLQIKGRHDPCIVPRALPALEAAAAVGLINLWAEAKGYEFR